MSQHIKHSSNSGIEMKNAAVSQPFDKGIRKKTTATTAMAFTSPRIAVIHL
jgi:hypothetical protein